MTPPAALGFMPLLRPGDLLFTAFVLRAQIIHGIKRADAIADVRGNHSQALNVFGDDAGTIGPRLFGSRSASRDILFQNTLFGVYSRGMSEDAVEGCVELQRHGHGDRVAYRLGSEARKLRPFVTENLRSCEKCVTADVERQRFSAWRVLHQVTALDRCPEHGVLLTEKLRPTRTAANKMHLWPLQLPDEESDAPSKKGTQCLPMSDGYASYLELWPRMFHGAMPILRPKPWYEFIGSIVSMIGDTKSAQLVLERWIEQSWGVSVHRIAGALSLAGGDRFVLQELHGNTRPKDVARRLIIYAEAKRNGMVAEEHQQLTLDHSPAAVPPTDERTPTPWQRVYDKVWAYAMAMAYPPSLVDALFEGVDKPQVARIAGVSPAVVTRIVKILPVDLLLEIARATSWSADSWLDKEMARRKISHRASA